MILDIIIFIVGWLYPALASYNSLNAGSATQLVWMKYWIVLGFFTSCHFLPSFFILWMPWLRSLAVLFLCWLLPGVGAGSQIVHDDILSPLLQRYKMVLVRGMESISNITCNMMSELIKLVYHLSVEVVEQCWLMSRNADDIYVTPRLQAAINDVIAEMRIARSAVSRPQRVISEDESECDEQLEQEAGTGSGSGVDLNTDDDIKVRILLAEAKSAERMHRCMKWASHEHLVPINYCVNRNQTDLLPPRPVKPKRNKRNAPNPYQIELTTYCGNCGHCDLCANADDATFT